ncbi:hypothetical protein EV177_008879 [Coemansia sp. RSA 1804]|nr:hypothetical protein EV177_008879 [Coemansia sp. RSA 1804]
MNFIQDKALLVDKSAAIFDVMSLDSGKVISGIYPRRMGKTTFLQTLANFLDILGEIPKNQREIQFRRTALFDLHPEFFDENFARYPVIMLDFKNNSYLQKGILVGVFDVRGIGLGSGLNNVESYLAHSGLPGTQSAMNPFQSAFGFTIHDVWGIINEYIDNQWSRRSDTAIDFAEFKNNLLIGCIRHFDGYRIGNVHHVFNPYAILRFVHGLSSIESPSDVAYSGHSYWAQTGSMRVLETIKVSSAADLSRYCSHLTSLFLRQSSYQQSVGPLAESIALDSIDDAAVNTIGSQEQPRFPSDMNKDIRKELADICMVRSGDSFPDVQSLGWGPLQAQTIMRLLYQAGYLAPIGKDCVGIPNSEVYEALEQFYKRIAEQHRISTDVLEPIQEEMGICSGNIQRFARSLHSCLINTPNLGEDTLEKTYQTILSCYLFPVTRAGYSVQTEAVTGNGRADILLFPTHSRARAGSTPTSYYVLELKRYCGATTRGNAARMATENRRAVAGTIYAQAMQAQAQIYERYYPTIADKARDCDQLYVVGISFWMNRFCMAATKRRRAEGADGTIGWAECAYEAGIVADRAVSYEQLGDDLENTENGGLREMIVDGSLVAITI